MRGYFVTYDTGLIVQLMGEADASAIAILQELAVKVGDPVTFSKWALHMDDMNIWGSQIALAYYMFCGRDMDRFMHCVITRDQAMVDFVNFGIPEHVAVTAGAREKRLAS